MGAAKGAGASPTAATGTPLILVIATPETSRPVCTPLDFKVIPDNGLFAFYMPSMTLPW